MDPAKRAKIETSKDHGLWGFFNQDKEALTAPKDLNDHGRFHDNRDRDEGPRLILRLA